MNAATKQLFDAALHLPESDRAELAASLIDSLDPGVDDDASEAWSQEIARRIAELDSGAATPVPWPEARRMILESSDGPIGS